MNLTVAIGLKAIVVNDDVIDVVAPLPAAPAAPESWGVTDPVSEGAASVSNVMFSASSCSNQCRFGLKPWLRVEVSKSRLFKRLCPSVDPSVRLFILSKHKMWKWAWSSLNLRAQIMVRWVEVSGLVTRDLFRIIHRGYENSKHFLLWWVNSDPFHANYLCLFWLQQD